MTPLQDHLTDYLRVRRALGFRLERDGYELGRFADHLHARGIETITVKDALAWVTRSPRATASHPVRLRTIRAFTRYLQSIGVPVEVPPSDLLPDHRRRAVPFLYTDAEIAALLEAAGTVRPPHRAAIVQTLIGLQAVTGMRRGEAIGLDRDDFDPGAGVLLVRAGKFGKSRELALHSSTVTAVSDYLQRADRPRVVDPTERALLLGDNGRRFRRTSRTTPSVRSGSRQACTHGRSDAGHVSTICGTRWPSGRCLTPTAQESPSVRGSSRSPHISGIRIRATRTGISSARPTSFDPAPALSLTRRSSTRCWPRSGPGTGSYARTLCSVDRHVGAGRTSEPQSDQPL
jgi:integrase